ncbi:MAG: HAD family hydrolase [Chloroflexi bacterium]|nr:HAD family hydrolase [Chloroflexota bacterium]
MLRAVLFDLDNTLIHYSEREFFERYVVGVMGHFADIMPGNMFIDKLLRGTQSLLRNNGEMSNADRFLETFCADHGALRGEIWARFMKFYDTEYERLRSLATVSPEVRDVFLRLRQNDVKLVIASNPIWPLAAQSARLTWAGLGDLRFDLITHIENTTYCKPNLEYYQEICGMIKETPEACLMVGNDPVNDMIVARIGMKTYLVTDAAEADTELSRSTHGSATAGIPEPDFQGSLTAVVDLIEGLLREGAYSGPVCD